ncbi:MarR family winged helix-turn-helix transcriptional regulator [Streptomyces sp. NPDC048200]|uniref:MarR family winged helix-turn-helix transcriptional regulator n=1 Tax=Streptomyces sp. NPDC048200 TaxID=3365512 RepID=UPI0037188CBC
MVDDGDLNGAAAPGHRPEAVAGRTADAVEELVELWISAGQTVVPRLSAHQLKALRTVGQRHELTLTGLAERVGIALPAASRLCDRLEAAGLLRRVPHPGNRRALHLLLTPLGSTVLTEIGERRAQILAAVLAGMTPLQRRSFEEGLRAFQGARRTSSAEFPPGA